MNLWVANMKILKFKRTEKIYGYLDLATNNIYIREDLKGYDYIIVVVHEYMHWILYKLFGNNKIGDFFNCFFDMMDATICTVGDIKSIRSYWRDYYGK